MKRTLPFVVSLSNHGRGLHQYIEFLWDTLRPAQGERTLENCLSNIEGEQWD